MNLHDIIKRTYNKIKKLTGIQVLSDNGTWEDISHISITPVQDVYEIQTESYNLKCSSDHILIDNTGCEMFAKDCTGKTVKTLTGPEKIISVKKTNIRQKLYDLSLVGDKHTYYTNGILSHNCLILDEFAFVPNNIADALFTAVYPVVSSSKNGKVIIVSTPNGKNNLYYDLWKKANNKNDPDNIDGWKPFRMDWWQIPGRDEKWKQAQIAAIGKTRFAQEFNNEFLDDVNQVKLISDEVSDRYRIQLSEFKQKKINQGKVLFVTSPDGKKTYPFTMYHEFDPSRTYLASSDVAEGVKKDSSVLYIWDVTDTSNIRMCAKFSENDVSILEFAFITREILKLYADPWLACESNGISLGYIEQLRVTYAYDNFVRMNKGGSCGIDSHFQLKTRACFWCRDMMTTVGFGFEFYDADLLDEFTTFVKKDLAVHTVYQAVKGSHDDHIMALVWACWILNPENVERYYDLQQTFVSSTGVVFPKTLAPYYEYTPSEIEYIKNSPIVKDFQIYKMMNNNEFLLEHERKVKEQNSQLSVFNQTQPSEQNRIQEMNKKMVFNEDEMIEMMRSYAGITPSVGGGGQGDGSSPQITTYSGNRVFTVNGGDQVDRRNLNVVWSTDDTSQDGIYSLFGFETGEFDGPEW